MSHRPSAAENSRQKIHAQKIKSVIYCFKNTSQLPSFFRIEQAGTIFSNFQ